MGWDRPRKSSKYRGVIWNKQAKKWMAWLDVGKKKYSKFCDTEIEAAVARDWLVLFHMGSGITSLNIA
jgi:hypothetical protein